MKVSFGANGVSPSSNDAVDQLVKVLSIIPLPRASWLAYLELTRNASRVYSPVEKQAGRAMSPEDIPRWLIHLKCLHPTDNACREHARNSLTGRRAGPGGLTQGVRPQNWCIARISAITDVVRTTYSRNFRVYSRRLPSSTYLVSDEVNLQ
jgi:hypothetical protein